MAAAVLGGTIGWGAALGAEELPEKPAESQDGAPTAGSGVSLSELGLAGRLTYKSFSHFRDVAHDGNFRNEGILQLEWRRKLASWSSIALVAEVRDDDGRFVRRIHHRFPDIEPHRSALSMKEAVLGLGSDLLRIELGKQIYTWGTGDAYNPTDQLNPYDYLDPIDREKMGVWSANATATAAGVSGQFVIVPLFTPSRDPLENGRWVVLSEESLPAVAVANPFGIELPTGATLQPRRIPATGFDTLQYATRFKTTRAGWDLSVSYYDGFESTPVLRRPRGLVAATTFEPVYTRVKAPGLDFSTTWQKFEFHGEAVAKFEEARGKDDRFQGLLGLNYTLDDLGLRWLEQLVFVVEHARETNLSSRSRSDFLESGAVANAFRDAVAGRLQAKFSQDTELTVGGSLDFTSDPSYYMQGKLVHKLQDTLHLEAGVDFFDGLKHTFWGKWRKNDRFFAAFKYFF